MTEGGQKAGAPPRFLAESELKRLETVLRSDTTKEEKLESVGTAIQSMLDHAKATGFHENITDFLLDLDGILTEEDKWMASGLDLRVADLVRDIPSDGIIELLPALRTRFLRNEIAAMLGVRFRNEGSLPTPDELAGLDSQDILSIMSLYGTGLIFGSPDETVEYLKKMDAEYGTTASSTLAKSIMLRNEPVPLESIIGSGLPRPLQLALFQTSFYTHMDRDVVAVSRFLVENKEQMHPELYRLGVGCLVNGYSFRNVDEDSIRLWREELRKLEEGREDPK